MCRYSRRGKNIVANLGPGLDKRSQEIDVGLPVIAQSLGGLLQAGLKHYGRSIIQRMRQRSVRVDPL
jgi:hypothetical protein